MNQHRFAIRVVRTFVSSIILLLLMLIFPSICIGSEIVFEDDFSNNFDKWQLITNTHSQWRVVNKKAEATVEKFYSKTEMVPKDEYWDSSWKEYEYHLEITPLEGVDKNIGFGYQDKNNWYEVHFREDDVNVVRVKNGYVTMDSYEHFLMENGTTYNVIIRFTEDAITLTIDNQEIGTFADWSYEDGGGKISLKAGTGAAFPTKVRFDNIQVVLIENQNGKKLDVPLFKQVDPQWKNEEYDTATEWSKKPSIGRWGCAMSSMAMILRYYGISQLPDKTTLTPSSLNLWLKKQPDGYIGQGHTNWLAATRLTKIMSQTLETPKLEYHRDAEASIDSITKEIDEDRPSILQINGHFLVSTGYTNDKKDLYIHDPAYIFSLFSEHEKPLLSSRNFTPSQTDLSYLLLVYKPELEVQITHQDGSPVSPLQVFEETVEDPIDDSGETSPHYRMAHIPKPNTGDFLVSVRQPTLRPFELSIFAYDQEANPTLLHQTGVAGPTALTFTINYQKENPSSISRNIDFTAFRIALKEMLDQKQLKKFYTYRKLDRIAYYGELVADQFKGRYVLYLDKRLQAYQDTMSDLAFEYLTQELASIIHS